MARPSRSIRTSPCTWTPALQVSALPPCCTRPRMLAERRCPCLGCHRAQNTAPLPDSCLPLQPHPATADSFSSPVWRRSDACVRPRPLSQLFTRAKSSPTPRCGLAACRCPSRRGPLRPATSAAQPMAPTLASAWVRVGVRSASPPVPAALDGEFSFSLFFFWLLRLSLAPQNPTWRHLDQSMYNKHVQQAQSRESRPALRRRRSPPRSPLPCVVRRRPLTHAPAATHRSRAGGAGVGRLDRAQYGGERRELRFAPRMGR